MTKEQKLIQEFEEETGSEAEYSEDLKWALFTPEFVEWLIDTKIKSLQDEVESLKEENANLGATNETTAITEPTPNRRC